LFYALQLHDDTFYGTLIKNKEVKLGDISLFQGTTFDSEVLHKKLDMTDPVYESLFKLFGTGTLILGFYCSLFYTALKRL